MFQITATTPPAAGPVTAAQLRARLRLNSGTAEDEDLDEFLAAAVELFEHDTRRPVLATTYRQDFDTWPWAEIPLGRGGVSAVSSVSRYLADESTEPLDADQWRAVLRTPPARVQLAATPDPVTTAEGIAIAPAGCVVFVAGWANAAAVPPDVLLALKMLAGHWYENREAWRDSAFEMRPTPDGWKRVVAKYKLGLSGDWGM